MIMGSSGALRRNERRVDFRWIEFGEGYDIGAPQAWTKEKKIEHPCSTHGLS